MLAVSRLHPFLKRSVISVTDLRNERFIFHQTGQAAAEICLTARQKAGLEPQYCLLLRKSYHWSVYGAWRFFLLKNFAAPSRRLVLLGGEILYRLL